MDFIHNDTSPEALAVLIEGFRRMTPAERLRRMSSLNTMGRQLAAARITAQYGDISAREMTLRLAALRLPRDLMIRATGWDPEIEGY